MPSLTAVTCIVTRILQSLSLATSLGATQPLDPPLSFEALQRYTDFAWGEGFGPEEEGDEAEEASGEAEEASEDAE